MIHYNWLCGGCIVSTMLTCDSLPALCLHNGPACRSYDNIADLLYHLTIYIGLLMVT